MDLTVSPEMGPDTPLDAVLKTRTSNKLKKRLNIETLGDLLDHIPRRWIDVSNLASFSRLIEGSFVTFVAEVVDQKQHTMQSRKGFRLDVTVRDSDGMLLRMAFFQGYRAREELLSGTRAVFQGKVSSYQGQLTLTNPDFEMVEYLHDPRPSPSSEDVLSVYGYTGAIPVYPGTEGITSFQIHGFIRKVLGVVDLSLWPDPITPSIREVENLATLDAAYRSIHTPKKSGDQLVGLERFRFQEALLLQGVRYRQNQELQKLTAIEAPRLDDGVLAAFDAQLPFELTAGQSVCGRRIAADLATQTPMNRLLQGEVGSGKTLVALRAMLQMVDAGAQAVLVAPTEVLAVQHERAVRRQLGELAGDTVDGPVGISARPQVQVVLLTGAMPTAARKQALLDIASGEADLVIGTHAVLGEQVSYAALGLVVIDEQHRFGVTQRNTLRERHQPTPHMLVMSATPIPRSVAMTVFGDLELTMLEGLPSGRHPITTHVVPMVRGPKYITRVWERIAEECHAGRQVYIVCPKIRAKEPSITSLQQQMQERFAMGPEVTSAYGLTRQQAEAYMAQDASIEFMEDKLAEQPQLAGLRIGVLHGAMDTAAKDAAMTAFERGETDILLATTVIEVGVDVPNATMMAVLDADSFGISTLHQLRGRIGRGSTEHNLCLLVTRMPDKHPSMERLAQVEQCSDGMQLARYDLLRRREGDILGSSQAGRTNRLKWLRIVQDEDLILTAGGHVAAICADDPDMESAPVLRAAIEEWRIFEDADYQRS